MPLAETAAKARVMSIRRTSEVPSTIEGMVLTGVRDAKAPRHAGDN